MSGHIQPMTLHERKLRVAIVYNTILRLRKMNDTVVLHWPPEKDFEMSISIAAFTGIDFKSYVPGREDPMFL